MAYFKKLITDKILKNKNAIQAQRLAACMAWQILTDYPNRQRPREWKIYNNLRGVMLADEVGGGKTFETLAIISKAILEQTSAFHNMDRFRVLILANPSIRSKWEWREREDLTFEEFNSGSFLPSCDISRFIKQTAIDNRSAKKLFNFFSQQLPIRRKKDWLEIKKQRQGLWLSSFSGLPGTKKYGVFSEFHKTKQGKELFPCNFYDWIIVDEAHSLKGGGKDIDETIKLSGSAIRKIFAVLNASMGAKILLLTATPFQNNKLELQHLLGMLEISDEEATAKGITKLISRGINVLDKEIQSLEKGEISIEKVKQLSKHFNDEINDLINIQEEERVARPAELKRNNSSEEGLDDFLRDIMIRNKKNSLPVELKIARLNEAEKFQYLLYRDLIRTTEEESQMFSTKLSQLVSSRDSFMKSNINAAKNIQIEKILKGNMVFEVKYKMLLDTIQLIKTSKAKNVITVFVSWLETADILEKRLTNNKFPVFKLTGQTPADERGNLLTKVRIANEISDDKIILIASRVGNEGLDFDKFCNRVIHYDNNFNPAIIDQRNGRVYRGSNIRSNGKKVIANDIKIYQLFIEESYDQRILFIEQEKRKMKDFYLGDASLQRVLVRTIEKNNLHQEKEILDLLDTIRINLTPHKKYILAKYISQITN